MSKNAKSLPVLTDDQKAILTEFWHEDASQLLARLWPDRPELTKRHIEWKAAATFLATIGKRGSTASGATPVKGFQSELSTSQKEFVAAAYKDCGGPVEVARTLFNNPKLIHSSPEVRAVSSYIRHLDPQYRREDEDVEESQYQPPSDAKALVARLRSYGVADEEGRLVCGGASYTQFEQKCLDILLGHMTRPAFRVEAEKFQKRLDREVFESTFLTNCWGKVDLQPEHVLQYIQLSSAMVQRNQADRLMRKLDERFHASLEDPDKKLSKPEVDALNATRGKVTEAVKHINQLITSLTGARNKMINERIAGSSSMHPVVAAWKTKEGRRQIMEVAAKYRKELGEEVSHLSAMDELKAQIFGISEEEILK